MHNVACSEPHAYQIQILGFSFWLRQEKKKEELPPVPKFDLSARPKEPSCWGEVQQ